MYSLIWQSVMWRPGKLRFLIGVKNPLSIDRPRSPENTAPCGDPPVARFATPVGLRPPFVTHPATLPHADRRALLILFAAQQDSVKLTSSCRSVQLVDHGNLLLHRLALVAAAEAGSDSSSRKSCSASSIFAWTNSGGNSSPAHSVLNRRPARNGTCLLKASSGVTPQSCAKPMTTCWIHTGLNA